MPGECTFERCTKKAIARGLCHGHYRQQALRKPLRPLRAMASPKRRHAKPKITVTPEYKAWRNMKLRCSTSKRNRDRHNYAERGIRVCEEWVQGFSAFLSHVGLRPSPGHSLDRIENNRGYEPGNVRWATLEQQAQNRRTNVIIEHDGLRLTASEWERRLGYTPEIITLRIRRGWEPVRAVTTPVGPMGFQKGSK